MRISSSQLQQYAINSILDQQSRLSKTQQQIASGKKYLTPSESPAAAVAALDETRNLDSLAQYQRNINSALSQLSLEEQTLASVQEQLLRLRDLAVEAGNATAAGRLAMSYEVRTLESQVLDMANTRDVDGKYLFGGFQNQTAPYTNAGGGVFTYNGDGGQHRIQIAPSSQIVAVDPGSDIFNGIAAAGGGVTDVLAIVDTFAAGLESNTFSINSFTDIDTALQRITAMRASAGARQNAVTAIQDLNAMHSVDVQQNLSNIQDLDYAEAVSRMNLQLAGLQAAQEAFSRVQDLSLFNYLR